jgi:hypothetical protein
MAAMSCRAWLSSQSWALECCLGRFGPEFRERERDDQRDLDRDKGRITKRGTPCSSAHDRGDGTTVTRTERRQQLEATQATVPAASTRSINPRA